MNSRGNARTLLVVLLSLCCLGFNGGIRSVLSGPALRSASRMALAGVSRPATQSGTFATAWRRKIPVLASVKTTTALQPGLPFRSGPACGLLTLTHPSAEG